MLENVADNQTEVEAAAPADAEPAAPENAADQVETEAEGDDAEGEESLDEVEFDGKQYRLPKELKDALLRQADYTRKTTEVAEQRKELEARQAAFQEQAKAHEAFIEEVAEMKLLDRSLAEFAKVDWQRFSEEDPVAAQKAYFQYQQLKEARGGIAQSIQQKQAKATQEAQQNFVKRVEDIRRECKKEIPEYTVEVEDQIVKYAIERGYTPQQLRNVTARDMTELYYAKLGRDLVAKSKSVAKAPPAPSAVPVTTIKPKAAAPRGPSDRQSVDEWMREREKQARRR